MKKARSSLRTTPSKASLREIPEVDFSRYTVRRNRFAMRVKSEGIEVIHESPSAESLAEIPEVDLTAAKRRIGSRRRDSTVLLQVGKGRPPRGEEVGPTAVRSIRLPASVWRSLEKRATRQRMTVHSLLRTAVVRYLEDAPAKPVPRRASRS